MKSVPPPEVLPIRQRLAAQTVDQTTEDTNQERIVGDRLAGDEVSQKAGQYHDTAGADSELRPQVLKADKSGNCVQRQVDETKRDCNSKKLSTDLLN